jgi:hypothetical protein
LIIDGIYIVRLRLVSVNLSKINCSITPKSIGDDVIVICEKYDVSACLGLTESIARMIILVSGCL